MGCPKCKQKFLDREKQLNENTNKLIRTFKIVSIIILIGILVFLSLILP